MGVVVLFFVMFILFCVACGFLFGLAVLLGKLLIRMAKGVMSK